MKFYQNIQKLRKEKGMSQEQLAEQLGVSRQTISKWESGAVCPTLDRMQELAALFAIPLTQLLGEAGDGTCLLYTSRMLWSRRRGCCS